MGSVGVRAIVEWRQEVWPTNGASLPNARLDYLLVIRTCLKEIVGLLRLLCRSDVRLEMAPCSLNLKRCSLFSPFELRIVVILFIWLSAMRMFDHFCGSFKSC